jgi:hypothetical protein
MSLRKIFHAFGERKVEPGESSGKICKIESRDCETWLPVETVLGKGLVLSYLLQRKVEGWAPQSGGRILA